jgi:hypothetical protein
MSDHWIVLIPLDPRAVPSTSAQQAASEMFGRLAPTAEQITSSSYEDAQFFDCGGNFERVVCPSCRAELSNDWWLERMDEDYDDGFRLATYSTPCCKWTGTLNDLIYQWPQGFARFCIEARNANIEVLTDDQLRQLGAALNLPVRAVYRRI